MKLSLTAALLSFITSTITQPLDPTTSNTLNTRAEDRTGNSGVDAGIQIRTYTKKGCKGDGIVGQEMFYNVNIAQQIASYKLSRDLGDDEVLNVMADAGWRVAGTNAIKPALNGDVAACARFVYAALAPEFTTQGCHTFSTNMGCLNVTI